MDRVLALLRADFAARRGYAWLGGLLAFAWPRSFPCEYLGRAQLSRKGLGLSARRVSPLHALYVCPFPFEKEVGFCFVGRSGSVALFFILWRGGGIACPLRIRWHVTVVDKVVI